MAPSPLESSTRPLRRSPYMPIASAVSLWSVDAHPSTDQTQRGLTSFIERKTEYPPWHVMFERENGVSGCRTRLSNVFDNQIPRSYVRTSLQTLVCRTAFDEPFDSVKPINNSIIK
ncbi:hypothetical protein SK128_012017 [Halocaridina rubra]|uniref:Uncharacterized protein n=1 Tax=Halocaridina rubra TaxID=373956 RepID=A0AAN8X583_HALRR